MAGLIYLLDTNTISDYINEITGVKTQMIAAVEQKNSTCLCEPVYYEVMRGLLKVNSKRKRAVFEDLLVPALTWVDMQREDWHLAASLWAKASSTGRQLSDVDLLLAAIGQRIGAEIVTSDDDFNALNVRRVNWRIP